MSFVIRDAGPKDLAGVFRLARHLDSYNLPADKPRLRRLLADSAASFRGAFRQASKAPGGGRRAKDAARRKFLFVLEEERTGRLAGCSLVLAKHGTPGLPHLFMTSFVEKRTSRTLGKSVEHRCLRLGSTEDGPTEVGGLVVLPAYRGRPERLGHWLSWVRFLYIAAHIKSFQRYVLAEFLPAFSAKGRSPFWDYFGRKFTGMSYRRADRLSIDNKEFVLALFPRGTIYLDFFPRDVVKYLGEVGEPSAPAARILRKIGFRYMHQVEPFDGGPYYGALTRAVEPVRRAKQLQVVAAVAAAAPRPGSRDGAPAAPGRPHLLMSEGKSGVRALAAPALVVGARAWLSEETRRRLRVGPCGWIWAAPLP
jgi:arginine N-succinyltransferase